ncbi:MULTISPECIES: site-specific integrase [unclassified Methylobacterium]|uniref:site-specific integrase n=1 Tax=unclassified Methylobacterium TaxID=2615210 RepID=UPI0011C1E498|nr:MULTISPECIES: site-specific integrase [unclassified Methylobacterium]QEE41801.1 site-specific integrase [Methylobacterium sp. WL1]TXN54330.1 site-specific integrase [Methylobacterium sp. WL2]
MPRLVRRDGVFYFRMAVPKPLVPVLRRTEMKKTLRTGDLSVAKTRARRLSEACDALFGDLRRMPELTQEEIDRRLRAYMQESLNKGLEFARFIPSDTVDTNAEVIGLRDDIKRLRDQLASQLFKEDVVGTAKHLLSEPPSGSEFLTLSAIQHASEGVARARIENSRILAARLEGRYDEAAIRDPLFAGLRIDTLPPEPGETPVATTQTLTLKMLGDRYLSHAEKAANQKKTLGDIERSLRLAYAVIGEDKPASSISTADVALLADVIGTIPPNFAKLGIQTSIVEAAAANAAGPKLEPATQEKLFRLTKAALKWAAEMELIPKQPGMYVKLPAVKKISKKDSRHPYSAEQLIAIFASPAFVGHRTPSRRTEPGNVLIRDGKFWIPWIGLYSGMRLGEIVQLLKSDIKQEAGVWYFDVSKGENEQKHIKTAASVRRVPIHQALIDAGLLTQIAVAKQGKRIFEDVKFGQDGYPSANFTKHWGRYGREIGFWTRKTTFHSFRHNLIQALKEAGVPKDIRIEIVGHESEDAHDNYGSGLSMEKLKDAIDKAKYPVVPPDEKIEV